jgi:DNA-binding response OmpR family regulator
MLLEIDRCRTIIEDLGGRLWIEQPDGPARKARFVLPLLAARPDGPDVTSLRRTVQARLPTGAKATRTLLLVVDNPGLGDLLTRDLTAAGYGVMLSTNGADALAIARQTRPDLILLDLMVRQTSAFDIATILRQDRRTRATPILFLTLVGDAQGGVSIRAVNYLVRPSGTGALVSAINAILTSGMNPSARVLVVEPNTAVRDTMVMMIQSHGYRVTEAAAPEEALALAERMVLGMILVNARLAQERDFWLLRNLRQVSADTGIYVLAEGLSEAEGRAAVSRGASGYSDTGRLPDLLDRVQNGHD